MNKDTFDQAVTASSAATIAQLDAFGAGWLSYGTNLPVLLAAADADPAAPLAQAYAAALHMALEAQAGVEAAKPYLARSVAGRPHANAREQSIIDAVALWAQGSPHAAARHLLSHVQMHQSDVVAAKWGQYLAFNVGDAALMLGIAEAVLDAHANLPQVHGMHAFGLEQCHRLEEAEDAGRRALALDRGDAWAQHAVAHVMETQGRVDEGVDFLRAHCDTWASRSIFMREHNWWHMALFYLDREEPKAALDVFDKRLWGEWREFAQEQIGAVSSLWRLELRGTDVGSRWRDVAAKIAERGPEHIWPFHEMHYVYGLARGGEDQALRSHLQSLDAYARSGAPQESRRVWSEIAAPLARGLVAHAHGRMSQAADFIEPLIPHLSAIGGSHAQRDIFVQTWIDAALKSGAGWSVRSALERRLRDRPNVPFTRRLLEASLGSPT